MLSMLRKEITVALAVVSWLLTFPLAFVFAGPFSSIENDLLDLRMRLSHPARPADRIVYIDIDDQTIALLGRWPWPRHEIAEIIHVLNDTNIWGMFIDILFCEETSSTEDLALVHALESGENVFLGAGVQLAVSSRGNKPDPQFPPILKSFCYEIETDERSRALQSVRTIAPLPSFAAAATYVGHVSFIPDNDGVVRRLPLLVDLGGRYFPSIDLEIARRMLAANNEPIIVGPGRSITLVRPRPANAGEKADVSIPVDSRLQLLINYAGAWSTVFKHYPLHAALRGLLSENAALRRQAEDMLDGKFVVLSAAFSGATDMGQTPYEPLAPLSEIHGHAISSIVNQSFLRDVPRAASTAAALIICLLLGMAASRLKAPSFFGLGTALILVWIAVAFATFSLFGLVIETTRSAAAIVMAYTCCAGYAHLKAEYERASLRRAFSRYVSPDVLSQIMENPGLLKLGGERTSLSILVVVFEKFERFSENAEPEEIVHLLNNIYEKACEAILANGGTVDKFTKDGLIAFFGAPIRREDHPESAVKAALVIKDKTAELDASRSRSGQGMVGVKMAINTGFATVGNIGSSMRMDYTAVGRTVNLCVHMAHAAAEGQILITKKTSEKLETFIEAQDCGEVRFGPYPKPFFVLNVVGLKESAGTVPPAQTVPAPGIEGKRFLGPYAITEKLGVGSTGAVYKAYDESLDRHVAIKVLFAGLRKDKMQAITEEAKTLAKMSHPNIVQVYYAGEDDDVRFLVMEFVEGLNLRELLNTDGPLRVDEALDIIIQTSRGLNAAYKQGIVHRDVKPANLLFNKHNVVKVTDFGLADTIVQPRESGRRVAGTFHYISPEQAQGLPVDCRSDIYSLGITLYHLLAGELPFKADTIAQMTLLHTESELRVEPLQQKNVPQRVIAVIQKMAAKKPDERYTDYLDLLRDLDRVEEEIGS